MRDDTSTTDDIYHSEKTLLFTADFIPFIALKDVGGMYFDINIVLS